MVKYIINTPILLLLAVSPLIGFGQSHVQEASLFYDVNISSNSTGKQAGKARYSIFWKGAFSRTEMKSNMGTEFSIYDGKSGRGRIFREYSGQKLMIPLDAGQWKEKHHAQQELDFQFQDVWEQKAGRNCKVATATDAAGRSFTVWFDPSIIPANTDYDLSFRKIPGLPISIEMRSSLFTYNYLLTAYQSETLSMSLFEADVKGFRTMSFDELRKMKKE